MADEPNTATPSPATPAATPDGAVNNTAAIAQPGAGTEPNQPQAQPEPKFTQADVDRILAQRLPKAVKAELKKMSGDGEGTQPNVEDLQRQLSDKDLKIRSYEARETVESFLTDGRNKLSVKPENVRGIQAIVIPQLEYDDEGKPSNLKEAIDTAKVIAPALFANTPGSINAGEGRQNGAATGNDMNSMIRHAAGIGQ